MKDKDGKVRLQPYWERSGRSCLRTLSRVVPQESCSLNRDAQAQGDSGSAAKARASGGPRGAAGDRSRSARGPGPGRDPAGTGPGPGRDQAGDQGRVGGMVGGHSSVRGSEDRERPWS